MNEEYRILIIDDEEVVLDSCTEILRGSDYELYTASNGAQGLELMKELKPDLIFVDLNIPQVSGYELIEKITRDRRTKFIPVVVISALPEDNLVDAVLNAGAQHFLEKPVALVDLLSVIEKFEAESSL